MRRILFLLVFLLPACTREFQAYSEFEVIDAKKKNCSLFAKEWKDVPLEAYKENMKYIRAECEKFGWWNHE